MIRQYYNNCRLALAIYQLALVNYQKRFALVNYQKRFALVNYRLGLVKCQLPMIKSRVEQNPKQ
jgi:hypothetical protein